MTLKLTALIAFAALILAAACNDAAPPINVTKVQPPAPPRPAADTHDHAAEEDAPRITLAEAKKEYDARTAVFVDTHSPEQYAMQHIPGSINIPANNVGDKADKLPKGKKIIAYCS